MDRTVHFYCCITLPIIHTVLKKVDHTVKIIFFQRVMAKFSNLSNRHAYEPEIVSELLLPVKIINTFIGKN